jgi:type VI protein secretion system component Hcp
MSVRKAARLLVSTAAALWAFVPATASAAEITYEIPGVTDGPQQLEAFSWGVEATVSSSYGRDVSVSRARFDDLRIGLYPSAGSPSLFRAAAASRPLPSARIDFELAYPPPIDGAVMSYCLEDVYITSFKQSLSGGEGFEELSLKYAKMTYAFSLGGVTVATVDIEEGTAKIGGTCA